MSNFKTSRTHYGVIMGYHGEDKGIPEIFIFAASEADLSSALKILLPDEDEFNPKRFQAVAVIGQHAGNSLVQEHTIQAND